MDACECSTQRREAALIACRVCGSPLRGIRPPLQSLTSTEEPDRGGVFFERAPLDITAKFAEFRSITHSGSEIANRIRSELDPTGIFQSTL